MRGIRACFWATRTEAIERAAPPAADRLRELLGLRHLPRGFLMELRFRRGTLELHAPTALDALNNPTFYPRRGPDGWGITDDLAGPRRTEGLPEAVAPGATVECTPVPWGDLAGAPSRCW